MRNPMTLGVLVVLLLVVAGCNPFLDRRGPSSPHGLRGDCLNRGMT